MILLVGFVVSVAADAGTALVVATDADADADAAALAATAAANETIPVTLRRNHNFALRRCCFSAFFETSQEHKEGHKDVDGEEFDCEN